MWRRIPSGSTQFEFGAAVRIWGWGIANMQTIYSMEPDGLSWLSRGFFHGKELHMF